MRAWEPRAICIQNPLALAMGRFRQTLRKILRAIPQQAQRQDSTSDQLRDLREFANRLGMYDAADLLRNIVERSERSPLTTSSAATQGPVQP